MDHLTSADPFQSIKWRWHPEVIPTLPSSECLNQLCSPSHTLDSLIDIAQSMNTCPDFPLKAHAFKINQLMWTGSQPDLDCPADWLIKDRSLKLRWSRNFFVVVIFHLCSQPYLLAAPNLNLNWLTFISAPFGHSFMEVLTSSGY